MPRLDIAFILCCCRACLGSSDKQNEESFYDLLGVERDATQDEIKRAYKRQSLQMHPDKFAQRGETVTEEDQARFTRMKDAYETLCDPHKRETYDAIGERGMKWMDQPMSMDPQEMAHNFATSSILDRSKIFSIFVFLATAIFIQPILICLQVDGQFGDNSNWTAVLTPLWIWNAVILFYHTRVIMMGTIKKPDHIPEEEWIDPLPMSKRVTGLIRYLLFFAFELQAALHLDGVILYPWFVVLAPLFILEGFALYKKLPESRLIIVTFEEIQNTAGKPFAEFTTEEKEAIEKNYFVIPSRTSAAFDVAAKQIQSAKQEVVKILLRVVFMVLLLLQLDKNLDWSWWLVFTPFFVASLCICFGNIQHHVEVQAFAEEKLNQQTANTTTDYGAMEEGAAKEQESGALSEEEKEEIKSRVIQSSSRLLTSCCSQFFFLILLCLALGKMQGAGFSSVWIISPFLFFASIILCLLGCMIFCVSPIDEDEMMFDSQNPTGTYYNMDSANNAFSTSTAAAAAASVSTGATSAPTAPIVVAPPPTSTATVGPAAGQPSGGENVVASQVSIEKEEQATVKESATTSAGPQVDLLDIAPQPTDERSGDLHGIVPTPSEVDDLD